MASLERAVLSAPPLFDDIYKCVVVLLLLLLKPERGGVVLARVSSMGVRRPKTKGRGVMITRAEEELLAPFSRWCDHALESARAFLLRRGFVFPYKHTNKKRLKTLTTCASLFKAVLVVFDRHLFPRQHPQKKMFFRLSRRLPENVSSKGGRRFEATLSLSLSLERARAKTPNKGGFQKEG